MCVRQRQKITASDPLNFGHVSRTRCSGNMDSNQNEILNVVNQTPKIKIKYCDTIDTNNAWPAVNISQKKYIYTHSSEMR